MMTTKTHEYGPLNILSQVDLADLLGVCVATIQKMRKDPGFPPRKNFPGKKGWLFKDILIYVENIPADTADSSEPKEHVV